MTGVITTGSNPKLLWPGIEAIWGMSYREHEMEYRNLFEIRDSNMSYEEVQEMVGFGLAPNKPQNESVSYAATRQAYTSRFTNQAYALGYIVTHEERMDNLYKRVAEDRTRALAFSMRTTKEIVAANVYNRAFSGSYTGADGVSLINASHPTDDGTQSNAISTNADLSEASLESLLIQIDQMENSTGLPIAARGKQLCVAPQNGFNSERILKSTLQSGTANNDINAIKSRRMLPDGFTVNHYFTDADAFFVRTDVENSMLFFQREAISFTDDGEFDTGNRKYKAYERYVPGWADFRGLFGSPGV